jgi:hypothetical protein
MKGESWKIECPFIPAMARTISIVLFGEWLMQALNALFREDQSETSVCTKCTLQSITTSRFFYAHVRLTVDHREIVL